MIESVFVRILRFPNRASTEIEASEDYEESKRPRTDTKRKKKRKNRVCFTSNRNACSACSKVDKRV